MELINFDNAATAARDVTELRDRFGMTDQRFWQLHHRRDLRYAKGIRAQVAYLERIQSLRVDHQETPRWVRACLEFLRAGAGRSAAIRESIANTPGARSK